MRVVVDSNALFWYLLGKPQLSKTAHMVLEEAEAGEGLCVSAASWIDLWYSTHKTNETKIHESAYTHIKSTLQDEKVNIVVLPISMATMQHIEVVPKADLKDPFDRMILATAIENDLPLVTSDREIKALDVVPVIW